MCGGSSPLARTKSSSEMEGFFYWREFTEKIKVKDEKPVLNEERAEGSSPGRTSASSVQARQDLGMLTNLS
ncbi:hypothetical protein DHD80_05650 [Gramella sp. AN32]|nr:hypothetical protein [Gramella sp. AN32]